MNINRRHLSAAQRAMAVAMIYPEAEKLKRKGAGSLLSKDQGFSSTRLSQGAEVGWLCLLVVAQRDA
jgi:hypothetical protein